MGSREIEGEFVMGWPDRKRLSGYASRDQHGRVIDARTPFADLEGLITPTHLRYVKVQMDMPEPVHPDDWGLSVGGRVEHVLGPTLPELQALPGRTVRVVTECSGSDAHFFDWERSGGESHGCDIHPPETGKPSTDDLTQLHTGQISTGEFTGTPLAAVLEKAGLRVDALGVRVEGFDRGTPSEQASQGASGVPEVMNYDKCLPLDKALDPDTIVAWALNGEYLSHVHGAPVRLVVPGWSGNWSVKWLHKLEVTDHMVPCWYQTRYFYYADSPQDEKQEMVTSMGVRTMIADPRDGDQSLEPGSHVIRGLAWSGCGAITRVEASVDGSDSWHDARLEEPREKWLCVRWSYVWSVNNPGKYTILARGTDQLGRVQPQTTWNFLRKNYDGIVPVEVTVR